MASIDADRAFRSLARTLAAEKREPIPGTSDELVPAVDDGFASLDPDPDLFPEFLYPKKRKRDDDEDDDSNEMFLRDYSRSRAPDFTRAGPGLQMDWESHLRFHLPLTDLGSGQVSLAHLRGYGQATFTRATTAWTKLSSGLWAQVASGIPRSCYIGQSTASGAYGGYLAEGARTNRCLQARDLTQADWTKTSATAAKDATGISGVANSASTLTATGADATCLQAITNASVARVFSAFVRRKTGTGAVYITLDNDTTRTEITSLINSTTYTLVQATQTLANPTVGFKLATSGDEIEIDMAQEETGAFASSPIPTTTVAVTRNADVLTYPSASNLVVLSDYTLYCEATQIGTNLAANSRVLIGSNDPFAPFLDTGFVGAYGFWSDNNGGGAATRSDISVSEAVKQASPVKISASKTTSSLAVIMAANGSLGDSGAPGTQTSEISTIHIGAANSSSQAFSAIKNVRIYDAQLPDSQLQKLTA